MKAHRLITVFPIGGKMPWCFGYSPECLLMPADGAYRDKIFIFEHDGGNGISQIADNLSDLFRQLATDSIGFLRRYYGMYWYDATGYHSG